MNADAASFLALDLGTHTGWAFYPTTGVIMSGSWDLSLDHRDPRYLGHPGLRYDRLRYWLDEFWKLEPPNLEVLYEQVHRHAGAQAAHVYGGLLAHLQVWCMKRGIVAIPVGVGQIKKFWTGRGNATKDDMIAEARARGFDPSDDNEADALALMHYRIVEGPIGETTAAERRKAERHARKLAAAIAGDDKRRSVARRGSIGLRASHRGVPEGGDEYTQTDKSA